MWGSKKKKEWRRGLKSIRSSGGHVLMLWSQTQLGAKEGEEGIQAGLSCSVGRSGTRKWKTEWFSLLLFSQNTHSIICWKTFFAPCGESVLPSSLSSLSPSLLPYAISPIFSPIPISGGKVGQVWIICLLSAQSNEKLDFIMKFAY